MFCLSESQAFNNNNNNNNGFV